MIIDGHSIDYMYIINTQLYKPACIMNVCFDEYLNKLFFNKENNGLIIIQDNISMAHSIYQSDSYMPLHFLITTTSTTSSE